MNRTILRTENWFDVMKRKIHGQKYLLCLWKQFYTSINRPLSLPRGLCDVCCQNFATDLASFMPMCFIRCLVKPLNLSSIHQSCTFPLPTAPFMPKRKYGSYLCHVGLENHDIFYSSDVKLEHNERFPRFGASCRNIYEFCVL